jgi:outer membrane protein OmpA-like peptidoglycan-associated protein
MMGSGSTVNMNAPGPKPPPPAGLLGLIAGVIFALGAAIAVRVWVSSAAERLTTPEAEQPKVAVADQSEVGYCTPQFKQVLERVLHSCGLAEGDSRRGCQPADVKTFASISDEDFNALFTPLKDRGAVVLFDEGEDKLDDKAKKLLEDKWFSRKGARYFFVVARASKSGNQAKNRALSHRRANSVMFHLNEVANDPDIESKVGLLWLGNEFAQLSKDYCSWPSSRPEDKCADESINRSAFVSWVDCRL